MFSRFLKWLKSFFVSSTAEENYALYKPEERLLYSYFTGKEVQCTDPLILYRKMMDVGPDLSADIVVSNSPSKDAPKAQIKVVEKIRKIFDVKPYEEGGLTEVETLGLLDHFLIYCARVKKNSRKLVTSSDNSEASPLSQEESQPITNSGDSGSIAKEQCTEPPTQSTSEQASLSDQIPEGNSGVPSATEKEKPSSTNPDSNSVIRSE